MLTFLNGEDFTVENCIPQRRLIVDEGNSNSRWSSKEQLEIPLFEYRESTMWDMRNYTGLPDHALFLIAISNSEDVSWVEGVIGEPKTYWFSSEWRYNDLIMFFYDDIKDYLTNDEYTSFEEMLLKRHKLSSQDLWRYHELGVRMDRTTDLIDFIINTREMSDDDIVRKYIDVECGDVFKSLYIRVMADSKVEVCRRSMLYNLRHLPNKYLEMIELSHWNGKTDVYSLIKAGVTLQQLIGKELTLTLNHSYTLIINPLRRRFAMAIYDSRDYWIELRVDDLIESTNGIPIERQDIGEGHFLSNISNISILEWCVRMRPILERETVFKRDDGSELRWPNKNILKYILKNVHASMRIPSNSPWDGIMGKYSNYVWEEIGHDLICGDLPEFRVKLNEEKIKQIRRVEELGDYIHTSVNLNLGDVFRGKEFIFKIVNKDSKFNGLIIRLKSGNVNKCRIVVGAGYQGAGYLEVIRELEEVFNESKESLFNTNELSYN